MDRGQKTEVTGRLAQVASRMVLIPIRGTLQGSQHRLISQKTTSNRRVGTEGRTTMMTSILAPAASHVVIEAIHSPMRGILDQIKVKLQTNDLQNRKLPMVTVHLDRATLEATRRLLHAHLAVVHLHSRTLALLSPRSALPNLPNAFSIVA